MPRDDTSPGEMKNSRAYRIGLAVSGGADSTALLVLMAELQQSHGFSAVVLHVDHGLRPDSSADARFVRDLAKKHSLPFRMVRAKIVRAPGESIEMAARRTRLEFFEKMMRQMRLDAIATGHHADDVAETFILRMARGSGADGLAGLKRISKVGAITFIRPLLDLRDSDLRTFLRTRGISWREDSTNADLSIPRNNVRHRILPWLRKNLDPHITEHLCKSAAILRGDLMKPAKENAEDDNDKTCADTIANRTAEFTLEIKSCNGYVRRKPGEIGKLPATCELSQSALAGRQLNVRTWKPGDRIAPIGMQGKSRKIQDVYVTAKVPKHVRNSLPVLVDETTDEILWIPGYRIAESVAMRSSTEPGWSFTLSQD